MAENTENLENPEDNIVYNPEAGKTKVNPTEPVEVTDPEDDAIEDIDDGVIYDESIQGPEVIRDQKYNIDVGEYAGQIGSESDDVFVPEYGGIGILNSERADAQTWYEQAGNFIGQAVVGEIIGGTIEGFGYLLDLGSVIDLMQGEETEWGNFMTEFGQDIREGTQDALQIHQDPNATGWSKMADSGWWFSNGVSVASTLSMLLPTTGAMKALSFVGKGIGASKGFNAARKAVGLAEQMGLKSRWMTKGVTQAVLSRNIENWMEAHGTFEDQRQSLLNEIDPDTGEKFTDDKATKLASEAAANNWKAGWVMLLQDIPQYLAVGKIFNPISKRFDNALDVAKKNGVLNKLKPWQQKAVGFGTTFGSEGFEESYQFMISENAKLLSNLKAGLIGQTEYEEAIKEAFGSEEMLTSAFFGGLGGNVFQGAGKLLEKAFKSKDVVERERLFEQNYGEILKARAQQVALMHQQLAHADQKVSPEEREYAMNVQMLEMAAEALEIDKFDTFYETLEAMGDMSKEDVEALNSEEGVEFSPELAKQNTPKILETARRMRDIYLKNRDKHGATSAARISKITLENETFKNIQDVASKEMSTLKNDIGLDQSSLMGMHFAFNEKKDILKIRRKKLKAALAKEKAKEAKNEVRINGLENVLAQNEANIKKNDAELANFKKNRNDQYDQNNPINMAAKRAYTASKDEILEQGLIEEQAKESIMLNNDELAYFKSKEGKKKIADSKLSNAINTVETVEEVENLETIIDNNETLETERVAKAKELLAKKKKALEIQKAADEAKAAKAKVEAEKAEEARRKAENEKTPETGATETIDDNLEDNFSDEEMDFNDSMQDQAEVVLQEKTGNGKSIAILNNPGKENDVKLYKEWLSDGTNKIGTKVEYKLSTRGPWRIKSGSKIKKAYEVFNHAKENNLPIPDHVYDYLPIRVFFGEGNGIQSYLPELKDNWSDSIKKQWRNNYSAERRTIINKLYRGESVITKVKHSSGGQLVIQKDENGVAAQNNVKDLKQVKDSKKRPHLVFTDGNGELHEVNDKKKKSDKFYDSVFFAGEDADGNKVPYAGGIFLVLDKADGTPFPVKLNFLNNTREQSEVLADLLTSIAVPDSESNQKKYRFDTPLSKVEKELQESIKEILGPEVQLLSRKGKDPVLIDIINMFVYVSDKTKNKKSALYMSGNHLYFGNEGKFAGPKNLEAMRSELIDFLTNDKKRQVSLNMWKNTAKYPGYRDFVLDEKIISTDVVVGQNEFQDGEYIDPVTKKKKKRLIKVYAAPLAVKQAEAPNSPKSKVIPATKGTKDKSVEVGETIIEQTGPSEKDINAAIAKEFPGKMYNYGVTENSDGTGTTTLGKIVSKKDMDKIKSIRKKMSAEAKKPSLKDKLTGIKLPDLSGVEKPTLFNKKSIVEFLQTQGLSEADSDFVYNSFNEKELKLIGQGKNVDWSLVQDRVNKLRTKLDDTEISKKDKKDLSSQKTNRNNSIKRGIGSRGRKGKGRPPRVTRATKISDKNIKPKDDTGKLDKNCKGQ